jgi:hypothetical protein
METKDMIKQIGGRRIPTAEQEEEFMLLMSLALDNLADEAEAAKFEAYLATYPTLAIQWQGWQRLHQHFVALPAAEPTTGFVERFEVHLLQQERRRRLWLGVTIGVITLLLWVGVMVGLFSMGAYLVVNQGSWLNALIQTLTYAWINVVQWIKTGWETVGVFAATPQAKAIAAGYLLMAATLLGSWVMLLRRSLQQQEFSSQASVA